MNSLFLLIFNLFLKKFVYTNGFLISKHGLKYTLCMWKKETYTEAVTVLKNGSIPSLNITKTETVASESLSACFTVSIIHFLQRLV